jgi:hypothetical protein
MNFGLHAQLIKWQLSPRPGPRSHTMPTIYCGPSSNQLLLPDVPGSPKAKMVFAALAAMLRASGHSEMEETMKQRLSVTIAAVSIMMSSTPSFAQQFVMCHGQYHEAWKGKCEPHEIFADCGQNSVLGEATKACRASGASGTPLIVKTKFLGPGNGCGYEMYRVTCR